MKVIPGHSFDAIVGGKLRKAKAEALKRGLVARSCAREGRKDVGVGSRTIATTCRQFHKLR